MAGAEEKYNKERQYSSKIKTEEIGQVKSNRRIQVQVTHHKYQQEMTRSNTQAKENQQNPFDRLLYPAEGSKDIYCLLCEKYSCPQSK